MAALIRSVSRFAPDTQGCFLAGRCAVVLETKRYVRGMKRKPVRVLFPEDKVGKVVKPPLQAHQKVPTTGHGVEVKQQQQKANKTSAITKTKEGDRTTEKRPKSTNTQDLDDRLIYDKVYPGDKRLGRLATIARSRTFREHQGKILLEGRRLICDALDAGAKPQVVFFSTVERLQELPTEQLRKATLLKVKFEDIKIWSDLVTPQGVIAIFSRPDPSQLNFASSSHSVGLSLICDNIRDPGNLGTILRCAAAAGCSRILLTKGCVDAWEPKVLRAAMGAHFRLPVHSNLEWDDIKHRLPADVTVHVADHNQDFANQEVDPYQFSKSVKPGEYDWVSSKSMYRKNVRHEDYYSDSDSEDEESTIDTKIYHESWAQTPAAIVIGGETHGLSSEAFDLAEETDGHRLVIPVAPGVDSLNSAMAASILLFEGRRQLLMPQQRIGGKIKAQK